MGPGWPKSRPPHPILTVDSAGPAVQNHPRDRVNNPGSACAYRTGLLSNDGTAYAGEPPNLFSLAFRFEKVRQVRQDPAGLASPVREAPFADLNEIQLAEKLAKAVRNRTVDLDRQLQADPALLLALAAECESLLGVRYYSKEAYRAWVAKLPKIPD